MRTTDLIPSDKGLLVVYAPFDGCEATMCEVGKLVSWNERYCYVRFSFKSRRRFLLIDQKFEGPAEACDPDRVRFLQGQV